MDEVIMEILAASNALQEAISKIPNPAFTELAKIHIDDAVAYCISCAEKIKSQPTQKG